MYTYVIFPVHSSAATLNPGANNGFLTEVRTPQDPKPETRNAIPEARTPNPETFNQTRNETFSPTPKPEIRNRIPKIREPKQIRDVESLDANTRLTWSASGRMGTTCPGELMDCETSALRTLAGGWGQLRPGVLSCTTRCCGTKTEPSGVDQIDDSRCPIPWLAEANPPLPAAKMAQVLGLDLVQA